MKKLNIFLSNYLPPKIFSIIKKIFFFRRVRLVGNYYNWSEALSSCQGYDSKIILEKVFEGVMATYDAPNLIERDSVVMSSVNISWPTLAGLLMAAARNKGELNVLDFGGSLGSSYFQYKKFIHSLKLVKWNVVEQIIFTAKGRAHFADEVLTFHEDIDDCLLSGSPNVILLSSVLQYLENPFKILESLLSLGADLVILDRTPFLIDDRGEDLIKIQKVPKYIYPASYPCRLFSERKLMLMFSMYNYTKLEQYDAIDNLSNLAVWSGCIFVKSSNCKI